MWFTNLLAIVFEMYNRLHKFAYSSLNISSGISQGLAGGFDGGVSPPQNEARTVETVPGVEVAI